MALSEEILPAILREYFKIADPVDIQFRKVAKLDSGRNYYLVQFRDAETQKLLVAIIDARNMEVSQSAEVKEALFTAEPAIIQDLKKSGDTEVELVWKPSRLSYSPFYPFWKVKTPATTFFVDQNGMTFNDLPSGRG